MSIQHEECDYECQQEDCEFNDVVVGVLKYGRPDTLHFVCPDCGFATFVEWGVEEEDGFDYWRELNANFISDNLI
jgi:hypothetical protein